MFVCLFTCINMTLDWFSKIFRCNFLFHNKLNLFTCYIFTFYYNKKKNAFLTLIHWLRSRVCTRTYTQMHLYTYEIVVLCCLVNVEINLSFLDVFLRNFWWIFSVFCDFFVLNVYMCDFSVIFRKIFTIFHINNTKILSFMQVFTKILPTLNQFLKQTPHQKLPIPVLLLS